MLKRSHLAGGVALWCLVSAAFPIHAGAALAGIPIAREMSLWPDWDHDNATMVYRFGRRSLHLRQRRGKWRIVVHKHRGKTARRVARWVERQFGGHRAGTHSLLVGPPLLAALAGLPALVLGILLVMFTDVSAGYLWPLTLVPAGAAFVGAASHIVLDFVTCNGQGCGCDPKPRPDRIPRPWDGRHRSGCQVVWPFVKRRYGLPWLAVGSDFEKQKVIPVLEVSQVVCAGAMVASWIIRA